MRMKMGMGMAVVASHTVDGVDFQGIVAAYPDVLCQAVWR